MEDEQRADFERLLAGARPRLHRYCARMVGSVIDGEDVVQDVLVKAIAGFGGPPVDNAEAWLFRIAHNASIDFLRRRKRLDAIGFEGGLDELADETASAEGRHVAAASLRAFMHLPVAQRGCVILMDVLGLSLREIEQATGLSTQAVKAALHRGRNRIRAIADQPESAPVPGLSQEVLRRLSTYVERFNARDFDAVRDMLADDVRLELVARLRLEGREQVSRYFHNYDAMRDWRLVPGLVDGRAALLVVDPAEPAARPGYFVLIDWAGDDVASIRDFRYARHVAESAEMVVLGSS